MSQPKVKATLAYIRKCYGVVIEIMSEEKTRKSQIGVIDSLDMDAYHVYPLRHSDNDWSRPAAVCRSQIMVNRYGWFITPDEMDFSKGEEINLTGVNAKYYDFRYDKKTDSARITDESTYPATEFDINMFFEHQAAIMEAFRYYVSKNYEEAGIRIIEPMEYKNELKTKGLGMLVEFKSADTEVDYCPDFKGIFCMNLDEDDAFPYPHIGSVNMVIGKFKGEHVHDVFLYEGFMKDNTDLVRTMEEYDIVIAGRLFLQESINMLKTEITEDPFKYLNLNFEDFIFKVLKRYNAKSPKERIQTKAIASSKIYSKKTSFEVNTQADLFSFLENYEYGTM